MSLRTFIKSTALTRSLALSPLCLAAILLAGEASAQTTNFIKNGDFTILSNGADRYLPYSAGAGSNNYLATVAQDWSPAQGSDALGNAYYGVYTTAGATTNPNTRHIIGPVTDPPDGGNFFFTTGAAGHTSTLSQTVEGLTPGSKYQLDFDWAISEFSNAPLDTVGKWQVFLGYDYTFDNGSSFFYTPEAFTPKGVFSGWMHSTLTFVAQNASETISFSGIGAPAGLPPIELLSGVSLTQVPETSSVLLFSGAMTLGLIRRRRR